MHSDSEPRDFAALGNRPPLVIVAAIGRNGELGRDGALPWTLPGDLAHFRALTMGTPMIMGRRTWDSIGRALPGRESIVVSRDAGLVLPEGVHRAGDPDAALALAGERARAMGAQTISLIGGATLFAALMSSTDRLEMTLVDLAPAADTFFPPIDTETWREVARKPAPRQASDEAAYVFITYLRGVG